MTGRPSNSEFREREIDAMLDQIAVALGLVPLELHVTIITTNVTTSTKKAGRSLGRMCSAGAAAMHYIELILMSPEELRILRAMSPAQKLKAAEALYHAARALKAAALRAQHPERSEEKIRRAVRDIFLYATT